MTTLVIKNTAGLGMWFQTDVLRLLNAIDQAIMGPLNASSDSMNVNAYRAGHQHTMQALATAFGLEYDARI